MNKKSILLVVIAVLLIGLIYAVSVRSQQFSANHLSTPGEIAIAESRALDMPSSFAPAESGKISADFAPAALMAPYFPMNFLVSSMQRSEENDANLIIKTTVTWEHIDRPAPSELIVRDKLGILESAIMPGNTVQLLGWGTSGEYPHDVSEDKIDLLFLNKEKQPIALAQHFYTTYDGQSILEYVGLNDTPILLTIGEATDCMEGSTDVCHPEISITTYTNESSKTRALKRGDKIETEIPGIKEIHLTDSHTYKHNMSNDANYARFELFYVYESESVPTPDLQNISYMTSNPYCTLEPDFAGGYTEVCSPQGKLLLWIKALRSFLVPEKPDYEYVVC